jgi:phage shock protein C
VTSQQSYRDPRQRRIYRDIERRWVGGVCAGIANYLAVPVFWVRLLTVLPLCSPMFPIVTLVYIIAVFRIPPRPEALYADTEEEAFLNALNQAPSNTFGQLRHTMRDLEHRLQRMEAFVTSTEFEYEQGMKN